MYSRSHPTPAALFLDFDNVFTSLAQRQPDAAEKFARDPLSWIQWLERRDAPAEPGAQPGRRILIRRCYLNPVASLPLKDPKPTPYSSFRRHFVRSGFHVIDCPPLTATGKTSADMVMAMDILDTLGHETRFGEFIILSSDADFTPVLLRVRAFDRIGTIVAPGNSADAYRAAADHVIRFEEFIRDGLGVGRDLPRADEPQELGISNDDLLRVAIGCVKNAGGQMNMAALGEKMHHHFGQERIRQTRWGGEGSLRALAEKAGLHCVGHDVALPNAVPAARVHKSAGALPADSTADPALRFAKAVNYFPKLTREALAAVLRELAETGAGVPDLFAADYRERLSESLSQAGIRATPGSIGNVVRRLAWGGISTAPAPATMDVKDLRIAFLKGLFAEGTHRVVPASEDDVTILRQWTGTSEAEAAQILSDTAPSSPASADPGGAAPSPGAVP